MAARSRRTAANNTPERSKDMGKHAERDKVGTEIRVGDDCVLLASGAPGVVWNTNAMGLVGVSSRPITQDAQEGDWRIWLRPEDIIVQLRKGDDRLPKPDGLLDSLKHCQFLFVSSEDIVRVPSCARHRILADIDTERDRQVEKFGQQDRQHVEKFQHYDDEQCPKPALFAAAGIRTPEYARMVCDASEKHDGGASWPLVLIEEVAEAVEAGIDGDLDHLRAELVQVAAVATAWVEQVDREIVKEGKVAG